MKFYFDKEAALKEDPNYGRTREAGEHIVESISLVYGMVDLYVPDERVHKWWSVQDEYLDKPWLVMDDELKAEIAIAKMR